MKSASLRVVGRAAVLGLALGMVGLTQGALITVDIFDSTDVVTATIDGVAVTPLPDSTDEFLHFNVPLTAPATNAGSVSEDLLEPGTSIFSDRLFSTVVQVGATVNPVFFCSDPALTQCPQGAVVLPAIAETGSPQNLFTVNPGPDQITFNVTSDIGDTSDIPEPSALLLLGTGLASLMGLRWRRGRRV